MFSINSWLSKKDAHRALKILESEIGDKNVGASKAGYLCNLLSYSAMRGYSKDECLKIINNNWSVDLRKKGKNIVLF